MLSSMPPKGYHRNHMSFFLSNIEIDEKECWLWLSRKTTKTPGKRAGGPYPIIFNGVREQLAHVWAYQQFKGETPRGLVVRHTCDVPLCVNPDHLLLGTHKDNSDDKIARGRVNWARGESTRHARLTAPQVLEIRAAVESGEQQRLVAARYGVTPQAVWLIIQRKNWKHI